MAGAPLRIAGIDEAGRGPLAGPVVASAVILPHRYTHPEITDSKQLCAADRERLAEEIRRDAVAWAVIAVGPRRIEELNIREATRLAMRLAAQRVSPDLVLVDGNTPIEIECEQRTVIGGDALHLEISAASILAKVWRDKLMTELSRLYPGYGFEKHSGYPTPQHKAAILNQGPCRIHRCTFSGVREHSDRYKRLYSLEIEESSSKSSPQMELQFAVGAR